jgi:hypothetical protein
MEALGEWLSHIWSGPSDADFGQWLNLYGISQIILLLVVIGAAVIYWTRAYNAITIKFPKDVFKQRHPWRLLLWLTLAAQVLFILLVGLAVVSRKSISVVLSELVVGAAEGFVDMLLYWMVTLAGSLFKLLPTRVKYIPWLSWRFPRRLANREAQAK